MSEIWLTLSGLTSIKEAVSCNTYSTHLPSRLQPPHHHTTTPCSLRRRSLISGLGTSSTLTLPSTTHGVGGQRNDPVDLPQRKRPGTQCTEDLVAPGSFWTGAKILSLPGSDPRTVQPVFAIPTHNIRNKTK